MKFLIVDDSKLLLQATVDSLRREGFDVVGVTPHEPGVYGDKGLTQKTASVAANVIFLDHNMPGRNGEQWLGRCKQAGVDFSQKRIIGISSDPQPYLTEQIPGREENIIAKIREIEAEGKEVAT